MNENFVLKQAKAGQATIEIRLWLYENSESLTRLVVGVYDSGDSMLIAENAPNWTRALELFRQFLKVALAATGASWVITDEERRQDIQ